MKKVLFTLCCLLSIPAMYAQTYVTLSSGTKVSGTGAVQVNLSTGSFVNNGTYLDAAGIMNLLGAVTFSGSGSTGLYNLGVNNASGTTSFSSLVTVNNTATITSGTVDANAELTLGSSANLVNGGVLTNNPIEGLRTIASATTGGCPSYTSNLSLNISGSEMLYQWQSSTDDASWGNVSGATNATYTATVTSTVYYRCNLTTLNSAYAQSTPGTELVFTGTYPTITLGTNPTVVEGTTTASLPYSATTGSPNHYSISWSSAATTAGFSAVSSASLTATPISITVPSAPPIAVYSGTLTVTNGCVSTGYPFTINEIGALSFVGGSPQVLSVCENSGTTSLNTLLAINDPTTGSPETWSVISGPTNGALGGFPAGGTSDGGVLDPTGLTYQPTASYSGNDQFVIQIYNGTSTATTTVNVTVAALPTVGTTGGGVAICSGSTVTLSGTGATSYSWTGGVTNGVAFAPGVGTDTYTVTGTTGSCSNTATATVTVNLTPTVGTTGGNVAICSGNTVTLSGTGATSYSWTGGVTNGVAFAPGVGTDTYTVTGTTGSCSNTATATVTVNLTPTVGATGGNVAICSGNTVTLSGTGATSYSWTGGVTNGVAFAPGVGTDTYTVTGTTGSCSNTATTTVTVNLTPTVGTTGGGVAICSGSTVTLSGTGATSYSWTGGVTNGVAFAPGVGTDTYTVTGTTGSCSNTATATVTVNLTPTVGTTGGNVAICSGNTVTLSGTGATSYSWTGGVTNGVAFAPGVGAQSYTVTGTTGSCSNTATTTITVNLTPTVGTTGGGVAICSGSTVTLSGTGATSYSWTGGVTDGVAFAPGVGTDTYTVTGTTGSCSNTATATVTVNLTPTVGTTGGNVAICSGNTVTLSGTGATSYSWTGGVTNGVAFAPGVGAQSYTVTGTTGSCSNTATTTVTVNLTPTVGTTGGGVAICSGSTVTLSGTGATSYSWTGGVTDGVAFAPGVGTDTYTVTGTTGSCSNTATATVTVNLTPTVGTTGGNVTICSGNMVTLSGTGATSYSWTGGVTDGVAFAPGVGTDSYTVTGTTGSCSNTATTSITVNLTPTISLGTNPTVIQGTTTANLPYSGVAGSPTTYSIAWSAAALGQGFSAVSSASMPGSTPFVITVPVDPAIAVYSGTLTVTNANSCTSTAEPFTVDVISALAFVGGSSQVLGVCENSSATDITSLLAITDGSTGATETWSVISGPANGSLNGFPGTGTSDGGTVTPGGLTYQPSGSYYGSDAFVIQISNGTSTATTTVNVTVTPIPTSINGTMVVCQSSTTQLTDGIAGGTWSSNNTSIATISTAGLVSGVTGGSATIQYSTGCGTAATTLVSVTAIPTDINGTTTICQLSTTQLSDGILNGTWSSSNTSVATVNPSSGLVSGVSGGSVTIQYSTGCGTAATTLVSVTAIPTSINGTTSVCQLSTTQLSDGIANGTWSSGNTSVATIDPSSGLVSGVSGGSVTIQYTTGCGTAATTLVSVTAIPTDINGTTTVCQLSTTQLSDGILNGTWSSSNTSVATVNPSSGLVSGVSGGSVTIQYSTGCGTAATTLVSVTAIPISINGTTSVCQLSTTQLSDGIANGTWSSGNTSVATIDPSSGLVSGVSGGSVTIQYTTGCGTAASTVVTVTAIPTSINGTTTVCQLSTTQLSDGVLNGTWSSSNTSVATVNPSSGLVSGVSGGSVTIQYSTGCGTAATTLVSVTAIPTSINGTTSVCQLSTTQLSDGIANGTWSSGNTSVATIDPSSGLVSGVSGGSVTIQYSTGCGTAASTLVSVTAIPTSINGTTTLCQLTTTQLSDGILNGTWSSSNTSVATVDLSSGLVSGVSGGSVTIQYSTGCGTAASTTVSVTAIPATINGTNSICVNATTQLSDAAASGTWSSSNTSIANVDGTGFVTAGPTAGTTTISYNTGCGTAATFNMSINATAAGTITGPTSVILGSTINLTDAIPGGVWSASNGDVTVSGGLVSAVSAGTVTISYAVTGTCGTAYATKIITVSNSLCYGSVTTLSAATPGGTWSMESLVATVTSGGVLTAATGYPGTATVTYTLSGVKTYLVVTVYPNPTPVQCSALMCTGVSYTLSDATGGGQWSASGDAIASGSGTSGTITAGEVGGSAVVTYTLPTGCIATLVKTVYSNPPPITGTFIMCTGATTTLTDASPLLNWKSSDTSVAKFVGSGLVGESAGTATITFTTSSAGYCLATQVVTVDALPAAIAGNTGAVCPGLTLSLTDGTGIWTSSNTTVASVASNGTVTGLTGGTSLITYLAGGTVGCTANTIVTVNTAPAITGTATTCPGGTTALHDALSGGTWSSGAIGTATVNSSGVVTGIADGSANITYTTSGGCNIVQPVNVSGISALISGNLSLCQGSVTTLSDASVGGTWSMSSTLATINGSSGVITASATLTGTSTVTYTSGGCVATGTVSVNVNPTAIQGAGGECAGLTTSLSDATAGGTWSITGGATLTGTTGSVTGLTAGGAAGTASVTYTLPTGCMAKATNTIYALPQPIQGNFKVCVDAITDLSDASPAGSWSSSATSIAVCSGPDITGEGAGTATITFKTSATGSCITTQVVTVTAVPSVSAISGPATISHAGGPVSISDVTAGGIWTSSNTSVIALAGSTGSPINISAMTTTGSSVITYAVTIGGCTGKATKTFTAASSSHPDGGSTTTISAGSAVSLADDMASGAWTSSDDGIATVGQDGLVTGIAPGNVTITHEITGDDGTVTASRNTVIVTAMPASVSLVPNPNKGTFVVKGTLGTLSDEGVTLEVTDVLGQVIYKNKVTAEGGKLNETISLSSTLANGMYILNVESGTGHTTVHFVIEQ